MNPEEKKTVQTPDGLKDVADLPGVSIDMADDEKVDSQEVKERTETLNNNPSNDYLKDN
ncbi:MAG: hypothetical protein K2M79_01560 [Muribaculaceae bacterium]|nr:hypothetical protein [Muribaculaceae bacterium]